MIPPFDDRGLLPSEPMNQGYGCTPAEVEQRFVIELGSPVWRARLFREWTLVSDAVRGVVPSARWWLWGCFVSNHPEPLWGESETMSSLVILPEPDLPDPGVTAMLWHFLQSAHSEHSVDAPVVIDFSEDSDDRLETIEALEFKWRPRASLGIADHATKDLVPAGFLEILP